MFHNLEMGVIAGKDEGEFCVIEVEGLLMSFWDSCRFDCGGSSFAFSVFVGLFLSSAEFSCTTVGPL